MMREILFRGQTRRKGQKVWMDGTPVESNWVYGGVLQGTGDYSIIYGWNDPDDKRGANLGKHVVYTDTLGQFTGLHDSTKWEDLTDSEKLDFYHQHYIGEDGMSVKFQKFDDVKHLWKGKKIFEGDIVRHYNMVDVGQPDRFELGLVRWNGKNSWFERTSFPAACFINDTCVYEVIGNIHDNPELLDK